MSHPSGSKFVRRGDLEQASAVRSATLEEITAELIDALGRGEEIDHAELRERFPEQVDQLDSLVQVAEMVAGLRHSGTASFPARDAEAEGELPGRLGDFEIGRELGRGGMGVVYEARQISLNRQVALKILPFASVLDPRQLQRFKNEALAAAQLDHPNIVDVYGVGCERGVHYYAMRLIEGESLAEALDEMRPTSADPRKTPTVAAAEPAAEFRQRDSDARRETPGLAMLSTEQNRRSEYFRTVAKLMIEAAEALHYAHEQGVIHRDVKPSNLLLDERGKLWVTDFGLAHVETGGGLTMSGELIGTLRYMSPEQASGQRLGIDHRTDVYSLGVTLYELLTFRCPFDAPMRQGLLQQILLKDAPLPGQLRSDVPVDLETIVLKAIEKSAGDRYASTQEMADDLRRFLQHEPIRARRATLVQRAAKWSRRHAAAIVTGSVITALSSVVAVALIAANHAELVNERNRANEQSRLAGEVVDTFYTDFAKDWMTTQPELTDVQIGFLNKALAYYERRVAESSDESVQPETAQALYRLASAYEFLSRFEEGESTAERAISAYEQLLALDDASFYHRAGLADCYYVLAQILAQTGRPSDARVAYEQCVTQRTRLVDERPGDLEAKSWLAHAKAMLAHQHAQLEDYRSAELLFMESVELHRTVIESDPDNANQKYLLGIACTDFAGLHLQQGNIDASEGWFRDALEWKQAAYDAQPHEPGYAAQLAWSQQCLARLLANEGRFEEAAQRFGTALALNCQLVERFPAVERYRKEYGAALNVNAWIRVTVTGSQEEARHAVELAELAIENVPGDGRYWNTLGVARYRAGNMDAAVDALRKSAELDGLLNAYNAFFLAMAHWQIGDKETAVAYFDDGVRWMSENRPEDEELAGFRAEAEALMGITVAAGAGE